MEISACENKLLPEILRVSKHGFCYHNALPKTSASPHLAQRSPFCRCFSRAQLPFRLNPLKDLDICGPSNGMSERLLRGTLQGTNISPWFPAYLKMMFLFRQVGYVSFLEGTLKLWNLHVLSPAKFNIAEPLKSYRSQPNRKRDQSLEGSIRDLQLRRVQF